jgi:peptidoglycan/LPS O-acetylase OafA/YrhL
MGDVVPPEVAKADTPFSAFKFCGLSQHWPLSFSMPASVSQSPSVWGKQVIFFVISGFVMWIVTDNRLRAPFPVPALDPTI